MRLMVRSGDGGVVFDILDVTECRALLALASVGRVGVTIDALPVVLPVNFEVDMDSVIFRSMPGTKLSAALQETVVAFEVDDYEPNGDVGWSVLVQGVASEISEPEQVSHARELPLRLLSPRGEADHFVRITMTSVTGRRIRPRYEQTTGLGSVEGASATSTHTGIGKRHS